MGDSKSAAAVEETLAAELAALQMSSADMAAENAQLQEDLLTLEGWAKRFLPTSESPQEQLPSEDLQGMGVPAANEELVRMQRQVMQETAELEAELQRLQQAIAQKKEDNARSLSPDKASTPSTASRTLKGKPAASKGGSSSNKLLPGGAQSASPSKSAGTGSSNTKALSPRASGVAPPKSPRASAQLQTKSGSAPRASGQPGKESRGLNLPGATSLQDLVTLQPLPRKAVHQGGIISLDQPHQNHLALGVDEMPRAPLAR